jgi:hypothetical protein
VYQNNVNEQPQHNVHIDGNNLSYRFSDGFNNEILTTMLIKTVKLVLIVGFPHQKQVTVVGVLTLNNAHLSFAHSPHPSAVTLELEAST